MVAHRPGHLLVVHLLATVHLHPTPRPGKLGGACHLGEQANEELGMNNSGYGRPTKLLKCVDNGINTENSPSTPLKKGFPSLPF